MVQNQLHTEIKILYSNLCARMCVHVRRVSYMSPFISCITSNLVPCSQVLMLSHGCFSVLAECGCKIKLSAVIHVIRI